MGGWVGGLTQAVSLRAAPKAADGRSLIALDARLGAAEEQARKNGPAAAAKLGRVG